MYVCIAGKKCVFLKLIIPSEEKYDVYTITENKSYIIILHEVKMTKVQKYLCKVHKPDAEFMFEHT